MSVSLFKCFKITPNKCSISGVRLSISVGVLKGILSTLQQVSAEDLYKPCLFIEAGVVYNQS